MPNTNKVEWTFSPTRIKRTHKAITQPSTQPQTKFWEDPANHLDSSISLDTFTSAIEFDRTRFRLERIVYRDAAVLLYGNNVCVVVEGRWTEIKFVQGMWINVFGCLCCCGESEFDDVSMNSIEDEEVINNYDNTVLDSKNQDIDLKKDGNSCVNTVLGPKNQVIDLKNIKYLKKDGNSCVNTVLGPKNQVIAIKKDGNNCISDDNIVLGFKKDTKNNCASGDNTVLDSMNLENKKYSKNNCASGDNTVLYSKNNQIMDSKKNEKVKTDYSFLSSQNSVLINSNHAANDSKKYKKIVHVNDNQNLMTIEDDVISVTTFIRSFRCKNEPYLSKNVQDYSFNYKHSSLAIGIIIHTAIQESLPNINKENLIENLKKEISKSTSLLFSCNIDEKYAMNECLKHLKHILKMKTVFSIDQKTKFEVEKKICCNRLCLRGKIDIVLDNLPIEIKTGRQNIFDTAQLVLYMLMSGLTGAKLFYTSTGESINLELTHSIVRDLLIKRAAVVNQSPIDCNCSPLCNGYTCKNEYVERVMETINEEQAMIKKIEAVVVKQENKILIIDLIGDGNYAVDKYVILYTKSEVFLVSGRIKEINGRRITVELGEMVNVSAYLIVYISVEYCEIFYRTVRFAVLMCNEVLSDFFDDKEETHLSGLKNIELNGSETESQNDKQIIKRNGSKSMNNTIKKEEFDVNSSIHMTEIYSDKNVFSSCSVDVGIEKERADLEYEFPIPFVYKDDFFKLNEYQRNALFQCLNTRKYHLVHGMPGTGKTSVIALLIKILAYYKKKILVVCYTNLALKNICDRLKLNIFYANSQSAEGVETGSVIKLKNYLDKIEVVASTCFSFNNPVFVERRFDFLVIDEGSQIHLPLGLIPMGRSEKVVVFGDHLQLKPLAKTELLRVSVFEGLMCRNKYGKNGAESYKLDEKTKKINTIFDKKVSKVQNISTLKIQYRMAKEIMNISNILFYGQRMICGAKHNGKLSFVDTSVGTPSEIFKKCDMVLCYFNSQVEYIRSLGGVAETIDRFQGSEADKVLICFDPVIDCEVTRSKERLNVALTRAKIELICMGDRVKMEKIGIFKQLLELLNIGKK